MKKYLYILFIFTFSISGFGQTLPTAMQTYNAMTLGWNIGNTMEAIGGETNWGNPLVTQRLIDSVKAAGFNTIRIPCAWDNHANQTTLQINPTWMARVTQVVDYCINRNLYVVLNIHWDGGWLENNCTPAMQASVNVKQTSYWTQIANNFKNYDGHLLFASANEPNVDNAAQMTVLLSYHQNFVNTVRATGGNNSSRVLVIQGPSTDIDKTNLLMTTLPSDNIPNRLMVEVHDYTPYNLCLMTNNETWGNMFYYWGAGYHSTTDLAYNATWGEEAFIDSYFNLMKTKYFNNCIPVIIGEFGANKRTNLSGSALTLHLASREYFYRYTSNAARRNGMRLMLWDTGYLTGINMTLFNRNTGAIADRGTVNALMTGFATAIDPSPSCAALPLKLIAFSADRKTEDSIKLQWSTVEEINTSHFEIEKSVDGTRFNRIHVIKAAGNSHELLNYEFLENENFSLHKVLYYRLKEIDENGLSNYSEIRKITSEEYLCKIYPNPIIQGEIMTIDLFTEKEEASISIFNLSGTTVYCSTKNTDEKIKLNTGPIPAGIYILELNLGNKKEYRKLIIQ